MGKGFEKASPPTHTHMQACRSNEMKFTVFSVKQERWKEELKKKCEKSAQCKLFTLNIEHWTHTIKTYFRLKCADYNWTYVNRVITMFSFLIDMKSIREKLSQASGAYTTPQYVVLGNGFPAF